jgi:hypothetical protein
VRSHAKNWLCTLTKARHTPHFHKVAPLSEARKVPSWIQLLLNSRHLHRNGESLRPCVLLTWLFRHGFKLVNGGKDCKLLFPICPIRCFFYNLCQVSPWVHVLILMNQLIWIYFNVLNVARILTVTSYRWLNVIWCFLQWDSWGLRSTLPQSWAWLWTHEATIRLQVAIIRHQFQRCLLLEVQFCFIVCSVSFLSIWKVNGNIIIARESLQVHSFVKLLHFSPKSSCLQAGAQNEQIGLIISNIQSKWIFKLDIIFITVKCRRTYPTSHHSFWFTSLMSDCLS